MLKETMLLDIRGKRYKSETDVKEKIKNILDYIHEKYGGVKHFPVVQTMGSTAGVPDRLACINGYFVAIEAKFGKGVLSTPQYDFLVDISNCGGLAVCVDETQLEYLFEVLENVAQYTEHCNNKESAFSGFGEGLTIKFKTYTTFME